MRRTLLALAAAAALALAGCSDDAADDSAATPSGGGVTVSDPWIAQPASDTSAMFGMVANDGEETVTLTGGSAPDVGMVQIHEFVTDGNTEVMQEVPGGLEVPAGGSVELKPGSYHVMLMEVTGDWKVGDAIPVTLDLSDGTTVEVTAEVRERPGMEPDEATMEGMESDGAMMEASPAAS
jgi:copper(I)-binding protein